VCAFLRSSTRAHPPGTKAITLKIAFTMSAGIKGPIPCVQFVFLGYVSITVKCVGERDSREVYFGKNNCTIESE
jgi:hypothetical protein